MDEFEIMVIVILIIIGPSIIHGLNMLFWFIIPRKCERCLEVKFNVQKVPVGYYKVGAPGWRGTKKYFYERKCADCRKGIGPDRKFELLQQEKKKREKEKVLNEKQAKIEKKCLNDVRFYSKNERIELIYNEKEDKAITIKNKYLYVKVTVFPLNNKSQDYSFVTNFSNILVGDYVAFRIQYNNEWAYGIVKEVMLCSINDVPYPLEMTSLILKVYR